MKARSGRSIFTALMLVSAFVARAQEDRLTLDDAIARALRQNFELRAQQNTVLQAQKNNDWGAAGLYPTVGLSGSASYANVNTKQEFSDGRTQERKGATNIVYSAGPYLQWTVYGGGRVRIVKKELAATEALEETRLRERMQAIVSSTIQAYATAVFRRQNGIAVDTALDLARARMILSRAKYDIGTSAKTDYLQARVDYGARQSDSLAQRAAMIRAFADLAAFLAEDPGKTYVLDDTITLDLTLQPSQPDLLKSAPLVDIARRNADIAALRYRLARTLRLPQLDVDAGYGYSRSKNGAGLLLFNQTVGPTLGAGINIPIYQGGRIRREIAVASLEQARSELLYERQITETSRQYASAWADYDAARSALMLERGNIGFAKENLDIQKARFRLGVGVTLETREAEVGYVNALVRLYTAAYNAKIAETRVREAEGTLVETGDQE